MEATMYQPWMIPSDNPTTNEEPPDVDCKFQSFAGATQETLNESPGKYLTLQFIGWPHTGVVKLWALASLPASNTAIIFNKAKETTDLLIRSVLKAPSRLLNRIFEDLRSRSNPHDILEICLSAYDETRRERYLTIAVSLLEGFGAEAWSSLYALARSQRPECEYFVDLIMTCPGIDNEKRLSAVRDLAMNPDSSVRRRVCEFIYVLDGHERKEILETLARDNDPEVSETAQESLSELK
jgi:hypothetical protein